MKSEFSKWWESQTNERISLITVRKAWDYQQAKIDELTEKLYSSKGRHWCRMCKGNLPCQLDKF
jgi:hypothetical protein